MMEASISQSLMKENGSAQNKYGSTESLYNYKLFILGIILQKFLTYTAPSRKISENANALWELLWHGRRVRTTYGKYFPKKL